MPKDEFRGYAKRFEKGGETLRDVTSEHVCDECGDGTLGLYRRVWRKGDRPGVTLYAIVGQCPKGHKVERYGYGELPKEPKQPKLVVRGVG